jgi:Fe-S oxidoreductase
MTMALPTGDVIGILADNLRLRRSVLPLSAKVATKWTESLGLRHGGDTVLYTGMMYQLIPYIEGLVKAEMKFGDSWLAKYTGLGRRVNRVVNISAFMARPSAAERAVYDQVPINVVHLLRKAGVEFGALFEDDLYSGALAYDLGADEVLVEHARRVHAVFKKRGVKTVITIDPHTTTMLRSVYPKILEGYDIEVRSYLEVLAEKGLTPSTVLSGDVAIHDSCVFARYEGVVDEPRELLAAAGVTIVDPENTGRQTWCCGGPVESLYPAKAAANAEKRVAQLREAAPDAVTMCPMCFVNLSTAAGDTMRFKDISEYLREAYAS